jgi:hypothetical protein
LYIKIVTSFVNPSFKRKKELLSDFERRNDQWAKQFVERVAKKEDEVKRHGELVIKLFGYLE